MLTDYLSQSPYVAILRGLSPDEAIPVAAEHQGRHPRQRCGVGQGAGGRGPQWRGRARTAP